MNFEVNKKITNYGPIDLKGKTFDLKIKIYARR